MLPGHMGVAAFLGAKQLGLLLRPAHEQHPLGAAEPRQVLVHDIVLAWPLAKSTHGSRWSRANRCTAALNASVIRASGAVEAIGNPSRRCTEPTRPGAYCNPGT